MHNFDISLFIITILFSSLYHVFIYLCIELLWIDNNNIYIYIIYIYIYYTYIYIYIYIYCIYKVFDHIKAGVRLIAGGKSSPR